MAGVLSNQYKDPRAQTLYGLPTHKYSQQEIRDFVKNSKSDADTLAGALRYGVDAKSIEDAMKGTPGYDSGSINKYISSQGIMQDRTELPEATTTKATTASPVTPRDINVTPEQTSAGQLQSILDSKSPLMQQAATMGKSYANKRGMLDSSIGATAAQDAMIARATPLAQQDAGTFYDANKTNTANQMQAGMFNASEANKLGMFNADAGNRTSMFNATLNKDVDQFNQNLMQQKWATQLDADNRLALANIDAMSRDSGIMGDLGKTYMNLYAQVGGDPNISPDVKSQMFNNLKTQFGQLTTLLPSFKSAGEKLNFGVSQGVAPTTGVDSKGVLDTSSPVKTADGKATIQATNGGYVYKQGNITIDTSSYKIPSVEASANNMSMKNMGMKEIDPNDMVPKSFIDEINATYGIYTPYVAHSIISNMTEKVQPKGTMRTDSPLFYIWKPAVSKYV